MKVALQCSKGGVAWVTGPLEKNWHTVSNIFKISKAVGYTLYLVGAYTGRELRPGDSKKTGV